MRALPTNTAVRGSWMPEELPPKPEPSRARRRARRPRTPGRSQLAPWLSGLRWVPAPLAVLAAVLGWLLLGSLQGQHAAVNAAHEHGYQAGGLVLDVDQMMWMSNDMSGQGPIKNPVKGFAMDPSMMPGFQPVSDDRLRVEVNLSNATGKVQRYALSDFRLVAPGGQSWQNVQNDVSNVPTSAVLEPGFQATVDVYFDVPNQQSKNLSVVWSRGGTAVKFPVNTSGAPLPHVH